MDNQNNANANPTNKEKAQSAGKDIAEVAARGAATYFGGPVGGKVAGKVLNTNIGQQVLNKAGNKVARNPIMRNNLARMQPSINKAKPVAYAAIGSAGKGSNVVPSNSSPTGNDIATKINKRTANQATYRPNSLNLNKEMDEENPDNNKIPYSMPETGFSKAFKSLFNHNHDNNDGTIKMIWKAIPLHIKLIAIGVLAGIFLLLFVIILISNLNVFNIFGLINNSSSSNYEENYESYYAEFCSESGNDCNDNQKQAAEDLKNSQTKFLEKFDSLSKKYSLSVRQETIVTATAFFDFDITNFSESSGAYAVDDNDEINYTATADKYEEEKDTLKELIKQFYVYTAKCKYTSNGNETTEDLTDSDGKYFTFSWWEYATRNLFNANEEYKTAVNNCEQDKNGTVNIVHTSASNAGEQVYYEYLINSTYFDKKENLKSHYTDYATSNNKAYDSLTEEDYIAIRTEIVERIKEIVKDEMDLDQSNATFTAINSSSSYWWPIGSDTTTEVNGKTFASDLPNNTIVNSPFGMRVHPISGKYTLHDGVDLHGDMGTTNIIASLAGTVLNVNNGCASSGSNGCGGGLGNYVQIQDTKGNINNYGHMYLNSITVKVGDKVQQGEVIGKVGSSGNSTGAHLHFTIKINGTAVDPLDYIDANNPRLSGGDGTVNFTQSSYTKEEFVSRIQTYYKQDGVCNSSGSQYVNGCKSMQNEINSHAADLYSIAQSYNINPELVIARSMLEGYSPGTSYNYFGYGCTNTGGIHACYSFSSFNAAMEEFFKNLSQYDSVESMMSRYAYLGDYWYTGEHSGWGGCYYASYIYPEGVPSRVTEACSKPDGYCTTNHESVCVATTEEDRNAYTAWQVQKMAEVISKVFG